MRGRGNGEGDVVQAAVEIEALHAPGEGGAEVRRCAGLCAVRARHEAMEKCATRRRRERQCAERDG